MHAGQQEEFSTELEDLDRAASKYAIAWTEIDERHRHTLRDDFICRLIPFADRLVSRYRQRAEPLEDLRQVARLGLIKAVDRYDPQRGSFTAFAFITINGEVKRHFRDRTWGVHVSRRQQDLLIEVGYATAALTQDLSRTPTSLEIARQLGVGEHEVRSAWLCAGGRTPVSLNTPLHDGDNRELGELIGSADPDIDKVTDLLALNELVHELPPEVQRMIIMRFHGNLTQSQIAAEFDLSQMHVSRLLRRGLAWLREAMINDAPPPPWSRVQEYFTPETMKVQIRQTAMSIDIRVEGEINARTADRLSRRLQSAISLAVEQGRLTVDLTRVHFIDATGAAMLREARSSASRTGVTTAISLAPHVDFTESDRDPPAHAGARP